MNRSTGITIKSVLNTYISLDQQIDKFSRITSLKCPEGCGTCCENPHVEATVLELLPLAQEIYLLGREEEILETINSRTEQEDTPCVLYRRDPVIPGNGRCLFYSYRPLICRLFGYAARKNKYNQIEFSPCKVTKQKTPHLTQRAEIALANGVNPPVFQESYYRVASVLPVLGFKRYPINRAIWEALAYLQWKKPAKPRRKKAA